MVKRRGLLWNVLDVGNGCRGKVVQVGDRDQIRRSPATPFVLNFIDDVNQLPTNSQFVKRMDFKADKPLVMCRPSVVEVQFPPMPSIPFHKVL